MEALAITVATKNFSPYLIPLHHKSCILTDSESCVQAYGALCKGEFSASPCVSTILSTVSRYQASVRHMSGSAILPSSECSSVGERGLTNLHLHKTHPRFCYQARVNPRHTRWQWTSPVHHSHLLAGRRVGMSRLTTHARTSTTGNASFEKAHQHEGG